METIFALATAQGKAGVSIVRVSGPDARRCADMFGFKLPNPRISGVRKLFTSDGEHLDDALVLFFEQGSSFTGEDVVELHLHGSTAIISEALRCLSDIPDFRMAEAGEFTRRALENGRLDLTQVEGLADLIESETEAQRKQALKVLSGELSERTKAWRNDLIRAAALLEATIDFVDEDVPVDVMPEVASLLTKTQSSIHTEIQSAIVGERIRNGFEVAILGEPNVGKSTLLNAIAGRDVAITSTVAGTTRDVIEAQLDIRGLPVTFLDTAGLRDSNDEVEKIGIARALDRASAADLRVFLISDGVRKNLNVLPQDIVLNAKSDITGAKTGISGKTGQGVSELLNTIYSELSLRIPQDGVATRERHRTALSKSYDLISNALNSISSEASADLIAEDLRHVVFSLDSLVGRIDVENLLDEIFSSFCIGK